MASNNETTTKFKVDISELKSAMQEAKRQIQVTNSEFKAISSGMEDWSKSTDGISAKLKQLNSNLNSQKTVLSSLERQYELTVEEMGEGSAEADRLKIAINNQKAVINGTEKEINKYEGALGELGNAESEAGDDAEELGKDVKQAGEDAKGAGEGFTVFKGVLANLATQGINLALDGIKSLGSAMVDMVKESVSAYADYEQLTGGIETLFKDSYDTVMENANNAFKTAGMSANEYMETVTSFSASLIQSLGGDTATASQLADMAITDMSDNVNKMGGKMEDVQNAYRGFAKQNYTMLDNLMLGYGGTQAEMQRLLEDAQKLSGIEYDISSYADIVDAIHVVQTEMGITGTTAKEASSTISGSIGMMKSAWTNLITGMADENANFDQLVTNLVDSVTTMIGNILPVATKAISGLGQLFTALAPVIATELPKLINDVLPILLVSLGSLFEAVLSALMTALPTVTNTIMEYIPTLVDGLLSALPQLISVVYDMVYRIIDGLAMMIPDLLKSAVDFFITIAEALPEASDSIMDSFLAIVNDIIYGLLDAIPDLMDGAITFFNAIVDALPEVIDNLLGYLPYVIEAIVDFIVEAVPQLVDSAITLFNALVDALPIVISSLLEALPDLINGIITGLLTSIPVLLQGAIKLFMALIDAIPIIIVALANALPEIIDTITTTLLDNMPLLLETTVQVLMALVQAIPQIVVALGQALPEIISTIVGVIFQLIPQLVSFYSQIFSMLGTWVANLVAKGAEGATNFVNKVVEFIKQLPEKMWTWLTNVITKVATWATNLANKGREAGSKLVSAVIDKVTELPKKMATIGSNVVAGIWEGMSDKIGWLKDKITEFVGDVTSFLKKLFGIQSPSKLMANEIGKWLPAGIAVGIDKNAKTVMDAMRDLTASTLVATRDGLTDVGVNGGLAGGVVNNFTQVINSPKQLSRLDIYRESKNLLGYAGGGY